MFKTKQVAVKTSFFSSKYPSAPHVTSFNFIIMLVTLFSTRTGLLDDSDCLSIDSVSSKCRI